MDYHFYLKLPSNVDYLGCSQARQLTRQLFDANLMVQQIEAIYDRVLADKVKKKKIRL